MSRKTDKFEIDCTQMLNSTFGHLAEFKHMGESDSAVSDIHVVSNSCNFCIEVKESSSQCCQFVLFPNDKTQSFDFSSGNKCLRSLACGSIISYMDERYAFFPKLTHQVSQLT